MIKRLVLSLSLPFFAGAQLNSFVEEWKKDKDLKSASISFCVLNAKNSELVAEHNSHQFMTPASTLKIVSTSAALNLLGNNYRYETKLCYRGDWNKETGVLNGDLVIVGSGDPTLQSENFTKDNALVTDKWAKIIKEKGIVQITGSIIGDASCYDRVVPNNWIWEDISNYYGSVPCGLSYRDNKFKILFTSKEPGTEAKIVSYAPTYLSYSYTLIPEVMAKGSEDEAYAYGDPFSFSKTIRGSIPPNKTNYEIEVALPDPALLCAENLYTSLTQYGIKCAPGAAKSNYQKTSITSSLQTIYSHFSPTLDKIIYYTNLKSNNLYCESILKTMGKGDSNKGLNFVKTYWFKRGLDTTEVYMDDASGLARIDGITTHFQASLLSKVYRDSSVYKNFNVSLPIAGKQGSMSSIGKAQFIENNMRAKTGYLTRVRAYTGYVKCKSGKELAFSVIFNNYNGKARDAKIKLEKFLVALGEL